METARISILSTLLVPLALWSACGGSDNNAPAAGSTGGSSSGTGGATSTGATSSGTGASTMGAGASGGTLGMNAGGAGGNPLSQPIDYDTSCADLNIMAPPPRDGGPMIPPGVFPDGGLNLKGCCSSTGFCGVAYVNAMFGFSRCTTPADARQFGIDAGTAKSCTYKAP